MGPPGAAWQPLKIIELEFQSETEFNSAVMNRGCYQPVTSPATPISLVCASSQRLRTFRSFSLSLGSTLEAFRNILTT